MDGCHEGSLQAIIDIIEAILLFLDYLLCYPAWRSI